MAGDVGHDAGLYQAIESSFKPEVVGEAVRSRLDNPRAKLNDEAKKMAAEVLRVMVVEGAVRAAKEALQDAGAPMKVELRHVEAVLPQLLLDFS